MDFKAISDFITFVNNSERYEKHLNQMKAQSEELRVRIAAIGEVKDIEYLREQAKADREAAAAELAAAKAEAADIKAKAKTSYDAKNAVLQEQEQKVKAQCTSAEATLKEAKDLHERAIKQLQQERAALIDHQNLLAKEREEVQERLAKLKAAMG